MVILIDTREKQISHITDYWDSHKIAYKSLALPAGDYSFMLNAIPELDIPHDIYFYNDVMIERKNSLDELSGCFTQTRERFNNEWSRCYAKRKYLLIERSNYQDIINSNYKTDFNSKSFLGSIHSFESKYDIHVTFMPDRNYSPIYILGVFQYYLRYIIK